MEDMLELANEVQDTLGRAYGLPEDVDEDDLEAGMMRCIYHQYHSDLTLCHTVFMSTY